MAKGYAVIFKDGTKMRDLLVVKDSQREAREFRTEIASRSRDHSGAKRPMGRTYEVVAVDADKVAELLDAQALTRALPVWKDAASARKPRRAAPEVPVVDAAV